MTRLTTLFLAGWLLLVSSASAQTPPPPVSEAKDAAKAKAPSCDLIYDAIIPLRPPVFSGVVQWHRVLGLEGFERIADLLPLADGGMVGVGESIPYARATGATPPQLYVMRFTPGGKALLEKRVPIKNFLNVAGAVIVKDQIMVLAQFQDDKKKMSAAVLAIDGTGAIKATHVLDDKVKNVIPGALVANADSKTLSIALMVADAKDKDSTDTVMMRLDMNGKVLSRKEFLPGVTTRIESLQRLPGGELLGAGRIRVGGERDGGWLLLVSREGDLVMQRPYARGGQSQLRKAIADGMGGIYAIGESIPAGAGYRAGWVMHLDGAGNIKWQRFLSGKYRYSAADMALKSDGRLMVLLAGRPLADGGREHARIVTLTPLGDILYDEAYLEGTNSIPTQLIEHSISHQRLLAGTAQTGFADYGIPFDQKLVTYDAWLSGLTLLPAWQDPCKPAQMEHLDDTQ